MRFTPEGHDAYWQRYYADEHVADPEAAERRRLMYRMECDHLLRHLDPGARVLDVGCADGGFLDLFAAEGHVCFGVEFSREAAAKAKEKYPVLVGEFPDLDFKEGFDAVIFRGVLQYVSRPGAYFGKAVSLLGDEGLVYVTSQPDMDCFCHGLFRNRFRFSPTPCDVIGFTAPLLEREFSRLGCRLAGETRFYEGTPYADPPKDVATVMAALTARAEGRDVEGTSPAFWGNMMTLVFRKCPKACGRRIREDA
jgi:SAM-dependent methyltransferase